MRGWTLILGAVIVGGMVGLIVPVAACLALPMLRAKGVCKASVMPRGFVPRHVHSERFEAEMIESTVKISFAGTTLYESRGGALYYFVDADEVAVGWPFIAAEGWRVGRTQVSGINDNVVTHYPAQAAVREFRLFGVDGIAPTTIRWGGLSGDWLIWGVVCGMSMWLCIFPKKILRQRRKQCVLCGYPLDGLAKCPECGAIRA